MVRRKNRLLNTAAVTLLVLAACGSSGKTASDDVVAGPVVAVPASIVALAALDDTHVVIATSEQRPQGLRYLVADILTGGVHEVHVDQSEIAREPGCESRRLLGLADVVDGFMITVNCSAGSSRNFMAVVDPVTGAIVDYFRLVHDEVIPGFDASTDLTIVGGCCSGCTELVIIDRDSFVRLSPLPTVEQIGWNTSSPRSECAAGTRGSLDVASISPDGKYVAYAAYAGLSEQNRYRGFYGTSLTEGTVSEIDLDEAVVDTQFVSDTCIVGIARSRSGEKMLFFADMSDASTSLHRGLPRRSLVVASLGSEGLVVGINEGNGQASLQPIAVPADAACGRPGARIDSSAPRATTDVP